MTRTAWRSVSVIIRGHLPTRKRGRSRISWWLGPTRDSPRTHHTPSILTAGDEGCHAFAGPKPGPRRHGTLALGRRRKGVSGAAVSWVTDAGKEGTGSHFTDRKTEAQRSGGTGSRSQGQASTVSERCRLPCMEARTARVWGSFCLTPQVTPESWGVH